MIFNVYLVYFGLISLVKDLVLLHTPDTVSFSQPALYLLLETSGYIAVGVTRCHCMSIQYPKFDGTQSKIIK